MRPVEALEAHADMLKFSRTKNAEEMHAALIESRIREGGVPLFRSAATRAAWETKVVGEATTFWVSQEMCDVASAAAVTMPDEPALRSDYPCEAGVLFFEKGLTFDGVGDGAEEGEEHEATMVLSAIRWKVKGDMVDLIAFEDVQDPRSWFAPRRTPVAWQKLPRFSQFFDDVEPLQRPGLTPEQQDQLVERSKKRIPIMRMMRAVVSLLGQTIAVVTPTKMERAARRRVARDVSEDLAERMVRVVTLRRAQGDGDGATGTEIVEWSHRWLVQGHWRRHWHPAKKEHRLIFIAPFVKGPQCLPFLPKLTVNALKR